MIMATCLGLTSIPASARHGWGWQGPSIRVQELSELHFGTIAPDQHLAGSVRVRPNRNSASHCGHPLICLEGGSRGRFRLSSTRTRFVHIDLPREATLSNTSGATMRVTRFRVHGRNVFRGCGFIRRNIPEVIGVGASLQVGAQQPPGHYRGTYEITVTYE